MPSVQAVTAANRSISQTAEILQANVEKLNDRDKSFAMSLLRQYKSKGALSERQMPYLTALADKATEPPPKAGTVDVEGLRTIIGLFTEVGSRLKSPKLTFSMKDGPIVRLYPCGIKSRYQGAVNVKHVFNPPPEDPEAPKTEWVGRINTDGGYARNIKIAAKTQSAIVTTLQTIAKSPIKAFTESGKRTGRCCFCGIPLSDQDKSVKRGYGKICAQNWGMPY